VTNFTVKIYQNEYLGEGSREVNAVVAVTAPGNAEVVPTDMSEIIIIDTSGSMNYPATKIEAARQATTSAIDCIRDGVKFGVIAGTWRVHQVYPAAGGLASSSPSTREEAKQAVSTLKATGGTAIGTWLALANQLFAAQPASFNHAILLTDGKNDRETPEQLEQALQECRGRFQCDCRGVGTGWAVSELRKVSSALLGSIDLVADPADLAADFTAMVNSAMNKSTAPVMLRVWTPWPATVTFFRQAAPTVEDLTASRVAVNDLTGDYPTGAWGDESRDYHIGVTVTPGALGSEMLAARISLIVGDQLASQGLIRAIWTDDPLLWNRIDPMVEHYADQAELTQVIHMGLEARKAGDDVTAVMRLGRAAQLAASTGNDETSRLLAKVVDVDDETAGTVRMKPRVDDADEMALDTRSHKTVRMTRPAP
jgi:hypothetical protein